MKKVLASSPEDPSSMVALRDGAIQGLPLMTCVENVCKYLTPTDL